MAFYLFRVHGDQYRIEKASGPRAACKLAFGVVYDDDHTSVRYKNIGNRSPKYVSHKHKLTHWYNEEGWERIPKTGE